MDMQWNVCRMCKNNYQVMGAFEGMTALLGDLVHVARSLGYPESTVCVLKGDANVLKRDFPTTYPILRAAGITWTNGLISSMDRILWHPGYTRIT